jgi:hypothetical protein
MCQLTSDAASMGKYSICMPEDLLQAIFLQYIGVKWSVFLKMAFIAFYRDGEVWKPSSKPIPKFDKRRREYFLGDQNTTNSVQSKRQQLYRYYFFMSNLLTTEKQDVSTKDGQEEADVPQRSVGGAQARFRVVRDKAARKSLSSTAYAKVPSSGIDNIDSNIAFVLNDDDGGPVPRKNPMEIK